MVQIHDIIGSMIIGGIILLMLLVFNGNVLESAGVQTFNVTVQGNLTTLADIVEYDFRKMGYRVAYPQDSAITYAGSTRIVFQGDFDNDGTIDRLIYELDTTTVSGISNPRVRTLYRKLNNQPPQSMHLGITQFQFHYYDKRDSLFMTDPVDNPSMIQSVKLSVNVESEERYDTTYVGSYWERKMRPNNIMNIK